MAERILEIILVKQKKVKLAEEKPSGLSTAWQRQLLEAAEWHTQPAFLMSSAWVSTTRQLAFPG